MIYEWLRSGVGETARGTGSKDPRGKRHLSLPCVYSRCGIYKQRLGLFAGACLQAIRAYIACKQVSHFNQAEAVWGSLRAGEEDQRDFILERGCVG